jgi:opacity protein-like surface antigen
MKKYVFLTFLLVAESTMAQTFTPTPWLEKGELQVGVGLGDIFDGYNGYSTRTAPYLQYFLKDRWAVRLEGQYEAYGIRGRGYLREDFKRPQYLGAGLATQYHFLKRERFSLYGQAGYSYGHYRANLYLVSNPEPDPVGTIRTRYGRFGLGAGVQYRLADRWLINALIEQQAAKKLQFKGGSTSVLLGLGFRLR